MTGSDVKTGENPIHRPQQGSGREASDPAEAKAGWFRRVRSRRAEAPAERGGPSVASQATAGLGLGASVSFPSPRFLRSFTAAARTRCPLPPSPPRRACCACSSVEAGLTSPASGDRMLGGQQLGPRSEPHSWRLSGPRLLVREGVGPCRKGSAPCLVEIFRSG